MSPLILPHSFFKIVDVKIQISVIKHIHYFFLQVTSFKKRHWLRPIETPGITLNIRLRSTRLITIPVFGSTWDRHTHTTDRYERQNMRKTSGSYERNQFTSTHLACNGELNCKKATQRTQLKIKSSIKPNNYKYVRHVLTFVIVPVTVGIVALPENDSVFFIAQPMATTLSPSHERQQIPSNNQRWGTALYLWSLCDALKLSILVT